MASCHVFASIPQPEEGIKNVSEVKNKMLLRVQLTLVVAKDSSDVISVKQKLVWQDVAVVKHL